MYHGRLDPEKGIDALMDAVEKLKKDQNVRPFKLVLIGRGSQEYTRHLQDLISKKQLQDVVRLAGFRHPVLPYVATSDFGILASTVQEGCPLSPQEYMSQGRPVVATDNGGQREYIVSGINGVLVPPCDSKKLAEAMAQMINDPENAARWGGKPRKTSSTTWITSTSTRKSSSCMEHIWSNVLLMVALWLGNYAIYLGCNRGIAPNARLQQWLRYLPASVVAVLPLAITDTDVLQPAVVKLLVVTELWALAYPLTYHLTYRKNSPDYDHQIDPAFALYQLGVLSGLSVLLPSALMPPLLLLSIAAPLFLFGYYLVYHHVIDMNGMLLMRQTNYNEILEFFRSFPLWKVLVGTIVLLGVILLFVFGGQPFAVGSVATWNGGVIVVMLAAVLHYLFKPRHSLFSRTGLVRLYLEVSEYMRGNSLYTQNQQQRMEHLKATAVHPLPAPHTILLVIGESASREFMSAFSPMDEDTTPGCGS